MYVRLKRFDDAEGAALAAYQGYSRSMGPDHEFTTVAGFWRRRG